MLREAGVEMGDEDDLRSGWSGASTEAEVFSGESSEQMFEQTEFIADNFTSFLLGL